MIALTLAGFLATLDRAPVVRGDEALYASIARSMAIGDGVPATLRSGAPEVDHLRFYGPVYFGLAAGAFSLFGLSVHSLRLVSLAGAVLIALAGVLLVRIFGGSRERQTWAAAVLLLAPELGLSATIGRMDSLAVGLELLALACLIASVGRRQGALYSLAAGLLLSLAALTTPRTVPFVAACWLGSAALWVWSRGGRAGTARNLALAALVFLAAVGAWAVAEFGSPLAWLRYLWFIATHEDSDVALLPGGRAWIALPHMVVTSAAAVLGALVAARSLRRDAEADRVRAVALFVAWSNFVVTLALFDLTFVFATYFAIPLLAVAMATVPAFRVRWRNVPVLPVLLLAAFAGVRGGKYVRLASVWSGRDPLRLVRFVRRHVPPRAEVIGPPDYYYFAVERGGADYRFNGTESQADWSRWASALEGGALVRRAAPQGGRYLIWPADRSMTRLAADLACARGQPVAVYEPPADDFRDPLDLPITFDVVKYPRTVIYRLYDSCSEAARDGARSTVARARPTGAG